MLLSGTVEGTRRPEGTRPSPLPGGEGMPGPLSPWERARVRARPHAYSRTIWMRTRARCFSMRARRRAQARAVATRLFFDRGEVVLEGGALGAGGAVVGFGEGALAGAAGEVVEDALELVEDLTQAVAERLVELGVAAGRVERVEDEGHP